MPTGWHKSRPLSPASDKDKAFKMLQPLNLSGSFKVYNFLCKKGTLESIFCPRIPKSNLLSWSSSKGFVNVLLGSSSLSKLIFHHRNLAKALRTKVVKVPLFGKDHKVNASQSHLSDGAHECLHVRGALAILAKNPESSSVNLGQTKRFKVKKGVACFKVTQAALFLGHLYSFDPRECLQQLLDYNGAQCFKPENK